MSATSASSRFAFGALIVGTSFLIQSGCSTTPDSPSGGLAVNCPLGQALCSGVCKSTASLTDCGGCGIACATGQTCDGSACQCQVGLSACATGCVDTASAASDCGTCGHACAVDELCSAGICIPASAGCPSPTTACGGGCVDTTSDVQHCGACDSPCGSGQACVGGTCSCSTGTDCGSGCVDTLVDPQNCGGCNIPCGAGQTCQAGSCTGEVLVGGSGQGGAGGSTTTATTSAGGASVTTSAGMGGTTSTGMGGTSSTDGGTTDGTQGSGGATTGGATTGGATTGGATTGGATTGGSTTGGSGGTSGGGSALADQYPCDSTSGYDVVMTGSGNNWTISGGGGDQNITNGMEAALSAAYGRLSGSSGNKATLLVQGDGSIDASSQLKMPSYMVLNICGTINVTGTASGSDRSPLYGRDRTDIDIPHARITGNPQYAMFFRNVPNVHMGEIHIELNKSNSGEGIRYDNNPSSGGARVRNLQIDWISVDSSGGHGVETYGADGITIGEFNGNNTHYCGLILNNSINAEVGSVTCQDCADAGTGYAAFRVANSNGNDGGNFPAGNIHVGSVYARGGDRGIFSVSGSGGLTVDNFDIGGTSGTPILLQNCYNTTLGAVSGAINGGEVRISNDTTNTDNGTYAKTSNTIISNTVLSGGASVREDWCDSTDRGNRAINVSGGTVSMCH